MSLVLSNFDQGLVILLCFKCGHYWFSCSNFDMLAGSGRPDALSIGMSMVLKTLDLLANQEPPGIVSSIIRPDMIYNMN